MNNEQRKLKAILEMKEKTVKVIFDKVVIRGRGLNWQIGNINSKFMGPMEAVAKL